MTGNVPACATVHPIRTHRNPGGHSPKHMVAASACLPIPKRFCSGASNPAQSIHPAQTDLAGALRLDTRGHYLDLSLSFQSGNDGSDREIRGQMQRRLVKVGAANFHPIPSRLHVRTMTMVFESLCKPRRRPGTKVLPTSSRIENRQVSTVKGLHDEIANHQSGLSKAHRLP